MLAAEALHDSMTSSNYEEGSEISSLNDRFHSSWVHQELKEVRNIRPSFHYGLLGGMAVSGLEAFIFKGRAPYTLSHQGIHLHFPSLTQL